MKTVRFQKITIKLGNVLVVLCLLALNRGAISTAEAQTNSVTNYFPAISAQNTVSLESDIVSGSAGSDARPLMASTQVETVASPLKCVAFSPYVNGYNPNTGIHPPLSVIDQLLDMIVKQGDYNCIMTEGVTAPLNHIFPAAQERGLKVFANIWLNAGAVNASKNATSIQHGITLAKGYPDTIVRVSCGIEVRLRAVNNGLPVSAAETVINDCLNQLRTAGVTQPITTIDTWWNWCNEQWPCQTWSMANNVDWLGVNVYPWWENKYSGLFPCTTAANAPQFHLDRIQDIQTRYPGKEVILTEFGWPAGPKGYSEVNRFTHQECGVASKANQNLVMSETLTKLNDAGLQGVAFEAFREPWKKVEGPVGPFWGIMKYIAKPALQAPGNGATVRGTPTYTWLASATAIRYQFEYDDSSDCKSPLYTSPELTTLTHKPPTQPLGDYYWHVQAKNSLGNWSAWSKCRSVHILPRIPVAPVLISPTNAFVTNDNTPILSWNSVPYGNTYRVQIATNATFTQNLQTITTGVGELSITVGPLENRKYYWRVRAININAEFGAWSAYRYFKVNSP